MAAVDAQTMPPWTTTLFDGRGHVDLITAKTMETFSFSWVDDPTPSGETIRDEPMLPRREP